jgi:hypothetical protein
MKPIHCRITFLLIALLLGAGAMTAQADGVETGHYRFTARYAAIHFEGLYPVNFTDYGNGTLKLSTDVGGVLTGEIKLGAAKANVAGAFIGRQKFTAVTLKTTVLNKKLVLGGRLRGTTITSKPKWKNAVPVSVDVSSTAPLDVVFDIDAVVDADGKITGTGTATVGKQTVQVTLSGTNKSKKTTLTIAGPKRFQWKGSGPPTENGFVATWTGKGFGAQAKGKALTIAP